MVAEEGIPAEGVLLPIGGGQAAHRQYAPATGAGFMAMYLQVVLMPRQLGVIHPTAPPMVRRLVVAHLTQHPTAAELAVARPMQAASAANRRR